MSDHISDADALAAAQHVLSLPAEEQVPHLIRYAQHVADERDRMRDVVDAAELLIAALDAGIVRDELTNLRTNLEALDGMEGT